MVCRNCQRENNDDAKYCSYCRALLFVGDEKPPRKADEPVLLRFGQKTVTDAEGRQRTVPPRPAPVKSGARAFHTRNTMIPKQREIDEDDLFMQDDDDEDEESFTDKLRHKVLSLAAGAVVLAAFLFVFWMLVFPAGGVFRAKMGLPASASCYERLGDELLNGNQVRSAADAYYDALRLDPDGADYGLALKVAQTQKTIGNTDKAVSAYVMCITLDPVKTEPYEALADIYRAKGEQDRAQAILEQGAEKTGDTSLLKY